jgi:hypothetical protein
VTDASKQDCSQQGIAGKASETEVAQGVHLVIAEIVAIPGLMLKAGLLEWLSGIEAG